MKISLFTLLPLVAQSITTNCNFLGTPNPVESATQPCICEDGWVGEQCDKLNFTRLPETSTSYTNAIFSWDRPTWGGSIVEGDGKYFWLGSTMPNSRGLSCWAYTSVCGIWEAKNITGPWNFVSYLGFGDYPGYNADDIPWCHNLVATLEYKLSDPKDINSVRKYAFTAYGIMKTNNNQVKMLNANFGEPNTSICSTRWAIRFPVDKQNQQMHVAYKELQATNKKDLLKEITKLLSTKRDIKNVNGYNRNESVNTELKWLNLKPKIPNVSLNAVNPAPLVSYRDNYGSFVKNATGYYNRVLSYRYSPNKESIGLVSLSADKFIWDTGMMYKRGPTINPGWNIEDPFFFESANGYHLIVHDGRVCGVWNSCGSMLHFPKNNPQFDMLRSAAGWSKPVALYNTVIDDLKTKTTYRQRPAMYFSDNAPKALLTGTIFANNRTSRTLALLIQY